MLERLQNNVKKLQNNVRKLQNDVHKTISVFSLADILDS